MLLVVFLLIPVSFANFERKGKQVLHYILGASTFLGISSMHRPKFAIVPPLLNERHTKKFP